MKPYRLRGEFTEKYCQIVTLESLRNIFLVKGGLKPAAMVDFSNCREIGYLWVDRESVMFYNQTLPELSSLLKENGPFMMMVDEPSERDEKSLVWLLNRLKLNIMRNPDITILPANETSSVDCQKLRGGKEPIVKLEINYLVGGNQEKLEKLIRADTDWNVGIALGYPLAAIRSYIQPSKCKKNSFPETLVRAAEENIALPSWFAYMEWEPERETKILHGEFPLESKKVAKRYRDYMREEQPDLAEIIEWDFYRKIKILQ